MQLRGKIEANVRSREGVGRFPRVAFFLRGKLMVTKPLVFSDASGPLSENAAPKLPGLHARTLIDLQMWVLGRGYKSETFKTA